MTKILITEDDKFLSAAYNAKLTKAGFDTRVATDGVMALDILKSFTPELIILDLIMPLKDGFSVLEELAQNQQTSNIPVIVMTNLGQKEDIDRAMKLGAKDYVIKSDIDPNQLVAKINSLLGL